MKYQTNRDISIIDQSNGELLVIACDSAGGIGNKPKDVVQVKPQIVGGLTARVALMELLSVGASPLIVVDTLSVEMNPTGREIIEGIRGELAEIDFFTLITGSTEENMPIVQTGLGVTAIGSVGIEDLKVANSEAGDIIVALGRPMIGNEVLANYNIIPDLKVLQGLLSLDCINEILPVGSKGILYEMELLSRENKLTLKLEETDMDLKKSAGPATVILVTLSEHRLNDLKSKVEQEVNLVGRLV